MPTRLQKFALLVVAAGAVLSAHAQPYRDDADRRLRNREAAVERRHEMDREGGKNAPVVVPATPRRALYHRGLHRHHGHRHPHRHPHPVR